MHPPDEPEVNIWSCMSASSRTPGGEYLQEHETNIDILAIMSDARQAGNQRDKRIMID